MVGLEIGGDDYAVKPFSPRELTARVRTVLRRASKRTVPAGTAGALAPHPLNLSRYEYLLLRLLIRNPGRVYSRDQLMEQVWDSPDMSLERTVDTHVKTLRQKLRAIAPNKEWVQTHRGVGYSLKTVP